MATYQNQPLPPGYEARWDPNQRAYFYINHYNKTTTWEDPRLTQHAGARQALNPASSTPQSREATSTSQSREAIPLSDIGQHGRSGNVHPEKGKETQFIDTNVKRELIQRFPTCPKSVIDRALTRHNNQLEAASQKLESFGYERKKRRERVQTREDLVIQLQKRFPNAVGVIPDVLRTCETEADAVAALEGLGFTEQPSHRHGNQGAASPSHPASPSRRAASPSHPASPSKRTASPSHPVSPSRRSPAHHQSEPTPVASRLSDADKAKMKRSFMEEYSHIGEYLVGMALEACDYDEHSTRAVLDTGLIDFKDESKESRPSTSASSRPSTSHSTASNSTTAVSERTLTPAPGTPAVLAETSLEPVAFTMDEDMLPEKPASASSRGSVKQTRQTSTKQQQHKPNHVTKMSEQLLTTTNDMLNQLSSTCCPSNATVDQSERPVGKKTTPGAPVVTQPHPSHPPPVKPPPPSTPHPPQGESSSYRTTPKGPDPSLRQGPDSTLRCERDGLAVGPDSSLRQGADPDRRLGSQGFNGPDPSLRCGPMNLGSNQGVLVSSI